MATGTVKRRTMHLYLQGSCKGFRKVYCAYNAMLGEAKNLISHGSQLTHALSVLLTCYQGERLRVSMASLSNNAKSAGYSVSLLLPDEQAHASPTQSWFLPTPSPCLSDDDRNTAVPLCLPKRSRSSTRSKWFSGGRSESIVEFHLTTSPRSRSPSPALQAPLAYETYRSDHTSGNTTRGEECDGISKTVADVNCGTSMMECQRCEASS
ncbi:hypothetical protein K437DRAFT_152863 [Tilletiaria anomala UBC 951]|uniref:Uncharacterized protein n=1 Tax=Tilletiaria anomala (strain ATCC 24038 / CBS 436.72 / UBC 951) TaxID=1037660 RepID=A0A066VNI3_TILAU|nr:uncharacterized protein K437DRAFT_152863 [Tilletiaria anomala UBC 951]KDN43302.1 hypothetical protein K437DRAFT_152863 [Tilletiaria anomala UBC 951]